MPAFLFCRLCRQGLGVFAETRRFYQVGRGLYRPRVSLSWGRKAGSADPPLSARRRHSRAVSSAPGCYRLTEYACCAPRVRRGPAHRKSSPAHRALSNHRVLSAHRALSAHRRYQRSTSPTPAARRGLRRRGAGKPAAPTRPFRLAAGRPVKPSFYFLAGLHKYPKNAGFFCERFIF